MKNNAKKLLYILSIFAVFAVMALCGSCGGHSLDDEEDLSGSVAFAKAMGAGWNLGNTLDAQTTGSNTDNLGLNTENSWGAPTTTKAMIHAVKARGFKTIRIPVSWHNHITSRTGYKIDSAWMNRVKQVVDWAMDEGLFVIINIHHDNLSENGMNTNAGFCLSSNSTKKAKSIDYIESVWKQVSETFKDYDENLIFEVLNEPRYAGTNNDGFSASGSELSTGNKIIREYEQAALNVIRSSGGKNEERYVMIPPYAASPWQTADWSLPKDSAKDKLLVSVHSYSPYNFALGNDSNTTSSFTTASNNEINGNFTNLENTYIRKGRGVVMGETSCSDKNNLSARERWFKAVRQNRRSSGVCTVLWDNMVVYPNGNDIGERHGYLNRSKCTWYYPGLMEIFCD